MKTMEHIRSLPAARIAALMACLSLLVPSRIAYAQGGFSPGYIVGPNDVLSVYVWNHPEISTQVSVSVSGTISYPLIGEVQVGGLTVPQVAERIREALTKYYVDPKVTVSLPALAGKKVSVTGAVQKPGDYDYLEGYTISQYIAQAGGFRDGANLSETKITRLGQSGAKVITLDLRQVVAHGRRDLDLVLEPGDTVAIPQKWLYSFKDAATIASLVLSAVTVYTLIVLRTNRR
jgi:polysaccharide export outer membrane protein